VKKQVIKTHLMEDQFLMEIKMQLFFNHPNILRLSGVFDDPQHIYLLLEYMEEGTLYARLKKSGSLPEEEASQLMADVLKAVAYLHENGVAHRDIKP
jgi:serine/threonine protein kinase